MRLHQEETFTQQVGKRNRYLAVECMEMRERDQTLSGSLKRTKWRRLLGIINRRRFRELLDGKN
jgi:hypothetical protein